MVMRASEAKSYFADKAKDYDAVDSQPYWAFSDALLWRLLQIKLLDPIMRRKPNFHLIDAGCGTARWSARILDFAPHSTATLIDISSPMLDVAREKLEARELIKRATLQERDLQTVDDHGLEPADVIICFHNVLGFVSDPPDVIRRLVTLLRPGGLIAIVAPNLYHGAYFSFATGRYAEIARVHQRHAVKFTDIVPELYLFTPHSLRAALRAAGAKASRVFGFPVTIYPQHEETTTRGNSAQLVSILSQASQNEEWFEWELAFCQNPDAASRGNNLLAIAQRKVPNASKTKA